MYGPSDAALRDLRFEMNRRGLDAYIVPTDDPHLSEYVGNAFLRRKYLTNFSGSAGVAVVTKSSAMLWTDSRYFESADLELNKGLWTLMKQGNTDVPTVIKKLGSLSSSNPSAPSKFVIGLDPSVHPSSFTDELQRSLPAGKAEVRPIKENLVDAVWPDRPPLPCSPFRVHPLKYAGVSASEKIAKVVAQMVSAGPTSSTLAVFSALDDVAYLLNLRASDIESCPVGLAFSTVSSVGTVSLYVDAASKVTRPEVVTHLESLGVVLRPYESLLEDLKKHASDEPGAKVWLDCGRTNSAIVSSIPKSSIVDLPSAVLSMKSVKNEAELEGMRLAHIADGVAMATFVAWLESTVKVREVDEIEIDKVLRDTRARHPDFLEPSFATIAGVGPNGAIVHYRAVEGGKQVRKLTPDVPVLIDSGGQYVSGTTDVTRVWWFGTPSPYFKDCYTRVLKGHIALDTCVFPEGTPGLAIDSFARRHLWEGGKDYGHGTGHGVGAALNVHEGPQSISAKFSNTEALKEGMVCSNEPGYYEGKAGFGIRVENLFMVREKLFGDQQGKKNGEGKKSDGEGEVRKKFLRCERITMVPMQTTLIDLELMEDWELDWVNKYHVEVIEKIGPLLEDGSEAKLWLQRMCTPISRGTVLHKRDCV